MVSWQHDHMLNVWPMWVNQPRAVVIASPPRAQCLPRAFRRCWSV